MRWLIPFSILLFPLAASAAGTQINLGDLDVPSAQVPDWKPPAAEARWLAAQSWPEYDATCANAPCPLTGLPGFRDAPGNPMSGCSAANPADDGAPDDGALNCMMNSAPANSVIYLRNGMYDMGNNIEDVIRVGRSDVVLRGQSNTGAVLRAKKQSGKNAPTTGRANCGDGNYSSNENCGAMVFSTGRPYEGATTPWIAGFDTGATVISVGSAAGLSVGDWVMLEIPNASNDCKILLPEQPTNTTNLNHALGHKAKIAAINGTVISLDQGLRMDYDTPDPGCQSSAHLRKLTVVGGIGIENLKLITDTAIAQNDIEGHPFIHFGGGTVESWAVGNHLERAESSIIKVTSAARIWIQGNTFKNWGKIDKTFNTAGINVKRGAVDTIIENNYFVDFVTGLNNNQGPEGTIVGYNYMRHGSPPNGSERAIFIHGMYSRQILMEGNDTDGRILTADHWWGTTGPGNTAYRNRVVGQSKKSSIQINRDKKGPWIIADQLNWMGNNAWLYFSDPIGNGYPNGMASVHDFDGAGTDESAAVTNMWVEKNIFRDNSTCTGDPSPNRCGFHQDSPRPDTSCGTSAGPGDCQGGTGDNAGGPKAPSSWANDNVPHSLYRPHTQQPVWWCQEACSWSNVHAGIGAWGDDFNGALCKLPAQIRAENGTCTLPSGGTTGGGGTGGGGSTGGGSTGGGGSSTPPAPPVLLP